MSAPKLRFEYFKKSWKEVKFGDITTKIGSGSTPAGGAEVYSTEGIPFIRSQNVNNNRLDLTEIVFITEALNGKMKGSEVRANDVLLNITGGSIGRSCVVPSGFSVGNVNQHVCILRFSDGYDPFFYQLYLSSNRGQRLISNSQAGGGREGLNFQSIRLFKVLSPDLEEQQKIANFLTAVDSRITQLAQKCDLLTRYKKGVMQQIFNQKLRFKDENGRVFPHWVRCSLDALGETYNGLTGKSAGDFGEGYPYVTYKQIFDNRVINQENFSLVKIDENEKQNSIKYGDLFFTTSSETAEEVAFCSVFLERQQREIYLNSFCFGFRPKDARTFNSIFASFLFRSDYFREKVSPLAQGSTRFNISKSKFIKLKVEIPCIQEQIKIANFLTAIDDKIAQAGSELEAVREYKRGLLQQMFV